MSAYYACLWHGKHECLRAVTLYEFGEHSCHLQCCKCCITCAWVQTDKEGELHTLARALLEHETLTRDDIQQVLAGTFSKVPVAREAAEAEAEGLLAGHAHHASQDSHSH